MNKTSLACFCLFLSLDFSLVFAQTRPKATATAAPVANVKDFTFRPQWQPQSFVGVVDAQTQKEKTYPAPAFHGCMYDENVPNLPFELLWLPVQANYKLEAEVIGTVAAQKTEGKWFEPTTRDFANRLKDKGEWYPQTHVMTGKILHRGNETVQEVRIYPIRISKDGRQYQQADQIQYRLSPVVTGDNPPQPFRTYAAHSVLQQGDWYKIAVLEDGIYRLDDSFFRNNGINVTNGANIRIFGNGGGMLPQANSVDRYDDLQENPIFCSNNGGWSANDYVLFYGQSPHSWRHNATLNRFEHQYNLYSDTNFYFVNVSNVAGKRITNAASLSPTYTPGQTTNFAFFEVDKTNAGKSGRYWVGDLVGTGTERKVEFSIPDVLTNSDVRVTAAVAARSDINTFFRMVPNDNSANIRSIPLAANLKGDYPPYYALANTSFALQSGLMGTMSLTFTYDKGTSFNSEGYLDWVEIEYLQNIDLKNRELAFFSLKEGVGAGNAAQLNFANAGAGYQVWDVTIPAAPQLIPANLSGSSLSCVVKADTFRRLVVFKGGFRAPVKTTKIANQDLHGLELADYIMLAHPEFMDEAKRLADFHRNELGHSVHLVTLDKVYNEFSGGKADISAFRDFLKMFHDRSQGAYPKYVLLFGDGSYDFKNIKGQGKNFIPTYQSRNYLYQETSYTSDDFFVLLSDEDGFFGEASNIDGDKTIQACQMDAAIGRLPVNSKEEAKDMVDKIIAYAKGTEYFGTWKNKVLLVGDYKTGEGALHMAQADAHAKIIEVENPCINIDKVYLDNYPAVITGSGMTFPSAQLELIQKMDEGCLIMNWTGHGSEVAWSNAYVLRNSNFNNISNGGKMPVVVTATCEFGRYDNPEMQTGAEIFALLPMSGSIAMFTTVRLVYVSPNKVLNDRFYREVFKYDALNQRMPTLGEVMKNAKNYMYAFTDDFNRNSRNFTLLGDPGITIAYPKLNASISEINGKPVVTGKNDTIPTLSEVVIKGNILNANGMLMNTYNGDMEVTVFDKPSKFVTKQIQYNFDWQKNRLFNGKVSIQNGSFTLKFIVPTDVSYENGLAKISLYFHDMQQDGGGCYGNLAIFGTGAAINDKTGPDLELFINDENWVSGGTTFPDPDIYAVVSDESGINISGAGIGHEITAVLNADNAKPIMLNDYYTADKDSYKSGKVRYKLRQLSPGEYTVKMKIWDVANNPTEAQTRFILAENAEMALTQVLNYPNPFSTHTEFIVGHNQIGKNLSIQVRIYTLSGQLIKTLDDEFVAEGNYYRGMAWDGLDQYGDRIGRGTYVYQVTLRDNESGKQVKKYEKLVMLR